jgi:uncharacterized protein
MTRLTYPRSVCIAELTRSTTPWQGQGLLADFERLSLEPAHPQPEVRVDFQAHGSQRPDASGALAPWLRLQGQVRLSLLCQRCLAPVEVDVVFDREFSFVATEEEAQSQDDESEEDVLVSSPHFDLLALAEDEFLMAVPVAPKHAKCPQDLPFSATDADFEADEPAPHPFAKLAQLKTPKS